MRKNVGDSVAFCLVVFFCVSCWQVRTAMDYKMSNPILSLDSFIDFMSVVFVKWRWADS